MHDSFLFLYTYYPIKSENNHLGYGIDWINWRKMTFNYFKMTIEIGCSYKKNGQFLLEHKNDIYLKKYDYYYRVQHILDSIIIGGILIG